MLGRYPFENSSAEEYQRLKSIQKAYDPSTIHQFEVLKIAEGWQCLEVGAGAGSIALWLCEKVGTTGRVLATDTNLQMLADLRAPNLEIIQHDVSRDRLAEDKFDLVHARFLLDVLSTRNNVLDKLVQAIKPGGWIVLEEFDFLTLVPDPSLDEGDKSLFLKVRDSVRKMWEEDGYDIEYGRKLPGQLSARGIGELTAEGSVFVRQGGTEGATIWRLSVEQFRSRIVGPGWVTEEELDRYRTLLENPKVFYISPLRVIARGRRLHAKE